MRLHVEQSCDISLPANQVFDYLAKLENFPVWNPWICFDPQIEIEVEGPSYKWQGPVAGNGEMREQGREQNRQLDYELEFYKPFKTKAEVSYHITEARDGCQVTWRLEQNLSFPGSLWAKWLKYSLRGDFELGLMRLNSVLKNSTSGIRPFIEVREIQEIPAASYIAEKYSGRLSEIGPAAEKAFARQQELLRKASSDFKEYEGCFLPCYKGNPIKDTATIEFATELGQGLQIPGMEVKQRPALRCVVVHLEADTYDVVRFVWPKLSMLRKGLGLKPDRRFPPFERYLPSDTSKIIEICIPVKS